MDNREDRHTGTPGWNHASTSAQQPSRPIGTDGLKPLAPLRPIPPAGKPSTGVGATVTDPVWNAAPMQPAQQPQGMNPVWNAAPMQPTQQPQGMKPARNAAPMQPTQQPQGMNPVWNAAPMQPTQQPQGMNPVWNAAPMQPTQQPQGMNPVWNVVPMQPTQQPQEMNPVWNAAPMQPAQQPQGMNPARNVAPMQPAQQPQGMNPARNAASMQPAQPPQGMNPARNVAPMQPTQQPQGMNPARNAAPMQPTQQPQGMNPARNAAPMHPTQQPQGMNPVWNAAPMQPTQQPQGMNPARYSAPAKPLPPQLRKPEGPSTEPPAPQAYPTPVWQPEARHPEPAQERRIWTQTVPPSPQSLPSGQNGVNETVPRAAFVPSGAEAQNVAQGLQSAAIAQRNAVIARMPAHSDAPSATPATEGLRRRRVARLEPIADEREETFATDWQSGAPSRGYDSEPDREEPDAMDTTDAEGLPDADVYAEYTRPTPPMWERSITPAAASNFNAEQAYPVPAAPKDILEDDSGRFEAIRDAKLAEPVAVPTYGSLRIGNKPRRKRRSLPIVLAILAVLAALATALFYTGVWDRMLQALAPDNAGQTGVPSVFERGAVTGDAAQPQATIAPAASAVAAELRSAVVDPASSTAPAELTFTLTTNAETSSIRLLTEGGDLLHTTAYGTPQHDGQSWRVVAEVDKPYTGKVRIFLRDQAGTWTEASITCQVEVQ